MGKLSDKAKNLLIPRKGSNDTGDLDTNSRAVERWAQQVGQFAGTIQEIVAGANVTVTNGNGPVVTIASTATIAPYASLTGPGQTTTPGDLTQAGGFTVSDTAGHGITLNSGSGLSHFSASVNPGNVTISAPGIVPTTIWTASSVATTGPPTTSAGQMVETFDNPSPNSGRWSIAMNSPSKPGITVQFSGSLGPYLGFFSATPIVQAALISPPAGGATVDTQARAAIVSILNLLGQASGGYGLTA